ncbi:MAG: hypothetical protein IJW26_05455 [Clostridia bacterium]|nr:hypothetical protein [Clostridia bacterium]
MKKILKIVLICLLIITSAFFVACDNSNPWNPPTNDFGDGGGSGFGSGSGEKPEGGGTIIKSLIIIE